MDLAVNTHGMLKVWTRDLRVPWDAHWLVNFSLTVQKLLQPSRVTLALVLTWGCSLTGMRTQKGILVHFISVYVHELRAFSRGTHLGMPSNWDKYLHGHSGQCQRALLSIDVYEMITFPQVHTTILQGGQSFGTYRWCSLTGPRTRMVMCTSSCRHPGSRAACWEPCTLGCSLTGTRTRTVILVHLSL